MSSNALSLETVKKAFVGNPQDIEGKLSGMLPQASGLEDQTIYIVALSKIALAQAMQKNFEKARETLKRAEKAIVPEGHLAKASVMLEKARIFHQEEDLESALPLYEEVYRFCLSHKLDQEAIDAAHMVAIVAKTPLEKIAWNQLAIDLAKRSKDSNARAWLGSLHHNLGQFLIEAGRYEEALGAFTKAVEFRKQEGYAPNLLMTKWGVARALRFLHRPKEALEILTAIKQEFENLREKNSDLPPEAFSIAADLIDIELTEAKKL